MSSRDLRGPRSFGEFFGYRHHPAVWYLGAQLRTVENVLVLPWQDGLRALGL